MAASHLSLIELDRTPSCPSTPRGSSSGSCFRAGCAEIVVKRASRSAGRGASRACSAFGRSRPDGAVLVERSRPRATTGTRSSGRNRVPDAGHEPRRGDGSRSRCRRTSRGPAATVLLARRRRHRIGVVIALMHYGRMSHPAAAKTTSITQSRPGQSTRDRPSTTACGARAPARLGFGGAGWRRPSDKFRQAVAICRSILQGGPATTVPLIPPAKTTPAPPPVA